MQIPFFRRYFSQFIPDQNGKFQGGETNGNRVEIFYGGRYRKFWLLPDGTVSMISTEPAAKYMFKYGRYLPLDKSVNFYIRKMNTYRQIKDDDNIYVWRGGEYVNPSVPPADVFTVEGSFPFFKIVETGDWVWLNADRSLTTHYVDMLAQARDWQKASDDVRAKLESWRLLRIGVKKRKNPRQRKIVLTSKIVRQRFPGGDEFQWSVFGDGKELASGIEYERADAQKEVARFKSSC